MRKKITVPIILILTISIAACGAPAMQRAIGEGVPVEAPAVESYVEREVVVEGPALEPSSYMTNQTAVTERLVIRNANLTLVVEDPTQSVSDISKMAQAMGGFVVSSNIYQMTYDDGVLANQASITIRVPAEQFDEALSQIKQEAIEIRNENVTGQDVTQEFTDLQSQLRNLEAAEEELREIMGSATDAEDVLRIFEHLRQVRQEIEVTKGRIQYLEQSARLSAISIDLLPDVAARPIQIGRWEPKGTAKAAVEALIKAFQFIADTAIWGVICVLPIAVLFGVPGWYIARAIIRRRKAQEEKS